MKQHGLPKTELLRKPAQYQLVYRQGRGIRGNNLTLVFVENGLDHCRLGISAHGFRKAVRRNRVKRIIREYYRLHRDGLRALLTGIPSGPGIDVIFAVRKDFSCASPAEIAAFMSALKIRSAGRRKPASRTDRRTSS